MYLYFSFCILLYHKLTQALIWIAEIKKQKQKNTTWPLYGVILFFIFIDSMMFALLFPKCNLLGSFVEDKFEVSTLDSASMDCVWVCMCVSVCVCVCFIRASINSIFLICLLLFFICYTPKQTEPQSWIMNNWNLENQKLTIRNEITIPKHWAVFTLIEYMNVAKALCSWNKKKKNKQVVPQISVYFIVAQMLPVDNWIHWLTLGYLI